jgi:PPM family protein phosphatase
MLNDRLVRWFSRPTLASGSNAVPGIPLFLVTDIGLQRKENQDRVAAVRVNTFTPSTKPFVVVALADGMGGMLNGSECATRALSAFFNAIIRFRHNSPTDRLELAGISANKAVYEFSKGSGGATLSAILVTLDQGAFTLNIGDSRIYATVKDGDEQAVMRLTVDDSLEEAVGGTGKELLQFIGMGDGIKPHVAAIPPTANRILVTSDGVHFIRHELLRDMFLYAPDPKQAARELVTLAKWQGAPDNASLAITTLSELTQTLDKSEETGIEVWDPFGALHVMWMKQDQFEFPAAMQPEIADHDPALRYIPHPNTEGKPKALKKASKSKASKRSKKKDESTAPQLTLEVVTPVDKGEDKCQ